MSESNEREEHIFAGALAVPEGERPGFLEAACGGDAELLDRIERLLEAHRAAGAFMDSPAAPAPSGDSPAPAQSPGAEAISGTRIGRYKLLQKIGEGGCGAVWMAEQEEPVRRTVALKIIKIGMDTREVIARFDAERQALAMMDHPNIARILDAGATEAGRPFFAMELVRGIKITDFCDRYNLSMEQRLELFSQVCHAVQHAHQKGVIHRDLKPSNILVTLNNGVPVPKVIDFGIAKATAGRLTDHTLFTAFEQFIGTPSYMSPEQAELSGVDIDTRSDIYSLGVLLYELLSGRLPFDPKSLLRAGIDEIRRIIREVEPPRPSSNLSTLGDSDRAQVARMRSTDASRLSMLLRGDLDWIVMRCLEKNRTRRYETPNALADDIARHLNHEPVVARPPSRLYRFNRLVRRNRLAFAAVASVALALLSGSVISTWQAVRAMRAERLADQERAQAVRERGRAEDLLKFMLGDLYTQLDKVGRLELLDAVADKATAYFASLSPDDLNDTTQLSRARALRLLGGVRTAQGRYADAAAALSEAYGRAADLVRRHPTNGEALFERSQTEAATGLLDWGRAEYAAASDWMARYRDTCAALVALDPKRPDWQLEAVDAQYDLAILSKERGEWAASRSDFLEELATLARMTAAAPGNFDLRDREAEAHSWLGNIAEMQGDYPEAIQQYTTQAKQLEYLAGADPKTVSRRQYLATALQYVGTIDIVTGRYPAASESLAQARMLLEDLVSHDTENVDWRRLSLNDGLDEAWLDRRRGDFADARRIVEKILPELDALSAREPTDRTFSELLEMAWRTKAQLQYGAGEADSEGSAAHAVEIGEKLSRSEGATGAELGECANAYIVAGDIAAKSGEVGAARSDWLRAAELLAPRMRGSRDWRLLDPYARSATRLGRFAEARDAIERLNQLGYVPTEPWPDLDKLATAKFSDPQPK